MRPQAGFTLVEVIVAGAIASVLAGSIITMLYLANARMKEGIALARMAKMYDIAAEQFHRMAREAYSATGDDETWPPGALPAGQSGFEKILFYNQAGTVIGGFRVRSDGYLLEWAGGGNFSIFRIGNDSLFINDPHNFAIGPNRRSVIFDYDLTHTFNGVTYQLTSPSETVLCRNTPN